MIPALIYVSCALITGAVIRKAIEVETGKFNSSDFWSTIVGAVIFPIVWVLVAVMTIAFLIHRFNHWFDGNESMKFTEFLRNPPT